MEKEVGGNNRMALAVFGHGEIAGRRAGFANRLSRQQPAAESGNYSRYDSKHAFGGCESRTFTRARVVHCEKVVQAQDGQTL